VNISIIVTNYNYEKYLARCLRSLLDQTLPISKYEIIFVDDCSTDNSRIVANLFADNIKTIYLPENVGLASATNIGLNNCTGRLIVRVDSDDFVHPNFLETLVLANDLLGDENDAYSLDYLEIDSTGNKIAYKSALKDPIACGIAFKSEVLLEIGAYKDGMRIFEEIELMKRFHASNYQIHNIALPLYRYVKHGNSLTTKVFR
jgi:glycosyltransferase involved in cell wall biosynthesis